MKLRDQIKQEKFSSPGHEAILNVLVTSSTLLNELAGVMAPFGITPAQFNVLRILRGSHPAKLPCTEVGNRLLDRTPDVTRLLNRLEKTGLIERERAEHDRRIVLVGITEQGQDVLRRLDPVVERHQNSVMGRLSEDEQRQLSSLLERLRE